MAMLGRAALQTRPIRGGRRLSPFASKRARLFTAAAACAGIGATAAFAQGAGVFAGQAYNDAAAQRGQVAYAQSCSRCHGGNLAGGEFGPTLTGAAFAGHWQGQSGGALLTYVQTRMPPGGAGTLPADTYADLAAYIMKANGAKP